MKLAFFKGKKVSLKMYSWMKKNKLSKSISKNINKNIRNKKNS